MANKPLTQETINLIQADWKTGAFTQRDLAYKYKLSVGAINNHTKGLDKQNQDLVNKIVETKQELNNLPEQEVNAVNTIVDRRVQERRFLDNAALKNVQEAMSVKCETQQDFKHRADTIYKARETIEPKNSTVQVNTQVNNTNVTPAEYEEIARRLLSEI